MLYTYQKTNRYFAQVADDIKDIADKELQALGAVETSQVFRGIYFTATKRVLYAINFHSRLINRVLAPLLSFDCHSDRYLYQQASQLHWEDFINPSQTFAVFASVSHSAIRHSKFAALRLKDAVADYFRSRTGERPSIDTENPDLWINLHIENNKATISLDTSGGSLHRRGYRKKTVEAPMIETLAAAIIKHTGWEGKTSLYDPFCGSGTLLCEAFMYGANMPPSFLRRKFGFEKLPDFDSMLWRKIKNEGERNIKPIPKEMIGGSDISYQAVASAAYNCSMIDKASAIKVVQQDAFKLEKTAGKTIVCNPPYGVRMEKDTDLNDFYKKLGEIFKQQLAGSTAYIYFGERKYIKSFGLKPSWKKSLSNGGLDGRLVKYELY